MVETLVSDLCECRPPLLIGGFFVAARSAVPVALLLDCFRLFFSSCSFLFPAECLFSGDYNGLYCILADFRPVNRLYFCGRKNLP
jgi:hypothetical protein